MRLNQNYYPHTRNEPPVNARPSYTKMSTPINMSQAYQERFHNSENGLVTVSEAITPSEQNHYVPIPISRSYTPDGRVRQRNMEEVYRMDKVHRPMQQNKGRHKLTMNIDGASHAVEVTDDQQTIEMLKKKIKEEQKEKEELNRTIHHLTICIQTLQVETYQARKLLEQETEENSWLRSHLLITKRKLETLNERHLVSTMVEQFENWK